MGAVSSRPSSEPPAQTKCLESRLASLGDLPDLQIVFSRLEASSSPNASIPSVALQECFELQIPCTGGDLPSSELSLLKGKVGSTLVDIVYEPDENGINWNTFLKGFEKCLQLASSVKLKFCLYHFYTMRSRAVLPLSFSFSNEGSGFSHDSKIVGHMTLAQLQDFLWICWLMGQDVNKGVHECLQLELPNVEPLVKAAYLASVNDNKTQLERVGPLWDSELSVEKLFPWMLLSIPGLSNCLYDYIRGRLHRAALKFQDQTMTRSKDGGCNAVRTDVGASEGGAFERGLLTSGVAWAVGLSQPDLIGCKLVTFSFCIGQDPPFLLYRSSQHGRGMNRFWMHVEGYRGAVLMLIKGTSLQNTEEYVTSNVKVEKWLVGAFVREGFENKTVYYGNAGCCLFALDPVMQPLRSTGKISNFVYSHTHVTGTVQQQQKPNGIAFGGDISNGRLWLDEDFSELTVRHHAVDKTYQMGQLLPNQGYAPITGKVLEVEVWGLGGKASKEQQEKFHQRESIFSEQKRKVDLQSFGNWTDAPEKMMMDMVSDPNKVQREER